MRVCLVSSPRFNCRPLANSLVPPGLAIIAAVARDAGHAVVGVDGVLIGNPSEVASRVAAAGAEVVGLNTPTTDRLACFKTIRQIRNKLPEAFIVVGGSHFTHSAVDAVESIPQIDAVVVGEGEVTFLELLEHLPERDSLGDIKGLVYRDSDGQIVLNSPRQPMPQINHLPMPAWDIFQIDKYSFHSHGVGKLGRGGPGADVAVGVMTTRGCPQSCVFCANSLNKKMRYLDPELAVDQLLLLQKRYGVTAVNIYDDDFLTNRKHAAAFCEELLKRNCRITWWCGARPWNLDPELLKLMKRAGCASISFGLENGTNEVLKAIRKNFTTEQVYEAMEIVGQINFAKGNLCLILGLPGETIETIDRSARFVRSLRPLLGEAWQLTTSIGQLPLIYPGTQLEALGRAEGCLPENFSWNRPFYEPSRHLPLVNRQYQTVPHFQSRSLPLSRICQHVRENCWQDMRRGRRRRFRMAPLRRLKVALHME